MKLKISFRLANFLFKKFALDIKEKFQPTIKNNSIFNHIIFLQSIKKYVQIIN